MGDEPIAIPDQRAIWDRGWRDHRPPVTGFARRALARAVAARGDGPLAIVEFGRGVGADARFFARRGHHVTALDFSSSAIARTAEAARRAGLSTVVARQLDYSHLPLPFPAASFDLAYSHLSLHYFPDDRTTAIFADIRRIVRPGGLVAIRCKSVADPLHGQGERLAERIYSRNGHVRHFYTKDYLAAKLAAFDLLTIRRTASKRQRSAYVEAIARRP